MEMKLAQNIRAFRKDRSLTQEQLSEVLGVTAGAVYKWEAGLSVPDIELIVEMADFFDTSVDVLLGYEMKDNRLDATVKRLQEYRRQKDRAGLAEAEKALKKYPHSFRIVNECASLYRAFGLENGDRDLLLRALALLEQALLLLGQNKDPQISEQTLYGKMAQIYLGLGEVEKGIELYKKHNGGGLYDPTIGQILAYSQRAEEAMPFLSEAMAGIIADLIHTITGYSNVYAAAGDFTSAQAILRLGVDFFSGLREGNKPNFLDKMNSGFLAALAGTEYMAGQGDRARASLKRARDLAIFFDAAPSYDESDIRFIDRIEGASVHDDIGATAMDTIQNVVNECENEAFRALWKQVKDQEETHRD